ncbi:MAG: hypothetical protein WEE89_07670 [Gemmatimonadota bacterium]
MERVTPGPNPFVYGRELSRGELVDRTDELETIAATIRNRDRLFLIGPRRFGKTSLLKVAGAAARRSGHIVLHCEIEKHESLSVLGDGLLREFLSLSRRFTHTKVGRSTRPVLTEHRFTSVTPRHGNQHETVGDLRSLTKALDSINDAASRLDPPVWVILDEVQHLLLGYGQSAERVLRGTMEEHKHIGYALSGSDERFLNSVTTESARAFYGFGVRLYLRQVPEPAFLDFLRAGFGRLGFSVEKRGLEAILESAEHVPYNVQRIANVAWEILRAGEADDLTPPVVSVAVERIVRQEDPAYTHIWAQLSTNQKKALKAVIAHKGENLQSAAATRSVGLSTSSMQTALVRLEQMQLIRPDFNGGKARYWLVDPCMGSWLAVVQAQ